MTDETTRRFDEFGISESIVSALAAKGIERTYPIQDRVLDDALAGRDILAQAPTGSGKTIAFAIPIIQRLAQHAATPAAIVLVPTRELCVQVVEEIEMLLAGGPHRVAPVYGGTNLPDQAKRAKSANIVVATPGRLIDLIDRRMLDARDVSVLVLDEADRMLDMGFLPQVESIVRDIPKDRHTMFFSATLDGNVVQMAEELTRNPVRHEVARVARETGHIEHQFVKTTHGTKFRALIELLEKDAERDGITLIFVRTKRSADAFCADLNEWGVDAKALHGDMPQHKREKTLKQFAGGRIKYLVATDVAARGLDLDDITHVIQFDAPEDDVTYTHRVGRTGRAGREGLATTLVQNDQQMAVGKIAAKHDLKEQYTAAGLMLPAAARGASGKRGRITHRAPGGWRR